MAGAIFLLKNGWPNNFIEFFIKEMEDVVIWLADNKIPKDDLELLATVFFVRFDCLHGNVNQERIKAIQHIILLLNRKISLLEKNCKSWPINILIF